MQNITERKYDTGSLLHQCKVLSVKLFADCKTEALKEANNAEVDALGDVTTKKDKKKKKKARAEKEKPEEFESIVDGGTVTTSALDGPSEVDRDLMFVQADIHRLLFLLQVRSL